MAFTITANAVATKAPSIKIMLLVSSRARTIPSATLGSVNQHTDGSPTVT
jgi:hypothetical protein